MVRKNNGKDQVRYPFKYKSAGGSEDGLATPQGNIRTVYKASLEMESPRKMEKGTLSKHLAMKCLLPLKLKVFIMILLIITNFKIIRIVGDQDYSEDTVTLKLTPIVN